MSTYAAFRRQPVPQQFAQNLQTITIPAPVRGIIQNENEAFMQPGGANVQTNWATTMKGVKLRGGCTRWCELPETTPIISAFEYSDGNAQKMYAANATKLYDVTSGIATMIKGGQASGNYFAAQMNNNSGDNFMIVGNDAGDFLLRTRDGAAFFLLSGVIGAAGDGVPNITYDPAKLPTGVPQGTGLVYAWKYRNRLYFIQESSMNAWYLPLNAVGGELQPIYLAGAATKGGKLLFGASWSIDAGDGIDDKCVFVTDLGELLIFTGSNPGDVANWRQEGRYQIGAPLGMNAHMLLGGDLLIATVDGIVPVSQAIQKDSGALSLALLTRNIKPLWRDEVNGKGNWPWTMKRWDEYGGIFVATPGGTSASTRHCLVANNETGAWFIYTWDVTCLIRMRGDMFFGTQTGIVMQADRTGYDDGLPYTATLVGGWETFQSGAARVTWHQARAVFASRFGEPFQPQLTATVDYIITVPPPPPPGEDPGVLDVWDEGFWGPDLGVNYGELWLNNHAYTIGKRTYDPTGVRTFWDAAVAHTSAAAGTFAEARTANPTYWTPVIPAPAPPIPTAPEREAYAQWDQPAAGKAPIRNTMWVSIGMSGFAHAPIVQVQVAQQARPDVELIAIGTTQERGGVNV